MSAIIKIGPHGGKIVGFHGTTPIYDHQAQAHGIHESQFPAHSPFADARAAGLQVRVHPTEHDKVEVAWLKADDSKAAAWIARHRAAVVALGPGVSRTSRGGRLLVPKAWAAVAPVPAAQPVTNRVAAPTPAPAPTPAAPAAPAQPALSPVMAAAGLQAADKVTLANPIKHWHDSPRHPVTVNGRRGELHGWETSGAPPIKTGRLVVLFPGPGPLGGRAEAFPPHDITPDHTTPNAPWHHGDVKVFRSAAVTASIKGTMAMPAPGQRGKSMAQTLGVIKNAGKPFFFMGGFVRDALQGKASKDIDLGFGADANEIVGIAQRQGLTYDLPGPGGLVTLGANDGSGVPPLEGKGLKGLNADANKAVASAPSSTGTDLESENIYGDFCHGRLWYDADNDTIIDPTGHGVEDALNHVLRIPVPRAQWDQWADGSPAKLHRYWKFKARGDKPLDADTHNFIVAKARAYFDGGGASASMAKRNLQMGWMGYDRQAGTYPPDAQKKLDAARASVIADMGKAWWDRHFAPHIPRGYH